MEDDNEERFDSIWYLTTGWFSCFSNIKKNLITQIIEYEFQRDTKTIH